MFELPEEHRMLQDLVAKFIDRDVIPLEKNVLAREMSGQASGLAPDEERHLLSKCKELGLWGLDVPEEVRRRQPALFRAYRRLRGTRPHLRPLHLPARQSQPPHADRRRQRRTASQIP